MKTKYKFIHFEQLESNTKTSVWNCNPNSGGYPLGMIKWYGPWRQYCFNPVAHTVFNKGCLEDINDFITQLMDARKKPKENFADDVNRRNKHADGREFDKLIS